MAISLKRKVINIWARVNNILPYLEFHLTDHCNLNCKGCGHFCPIAPPFFADIGKFENDLVQLSKLFKNIKRIRLMGGEPLLHPQVSTFIRKTKTIFPTTDIRFVTNGILLPKADKKFWNTCRATKTIIDLTVYPPFERSIKKWRDLCVKNSILLRCTRSKNVFYAQMNPKGDSNTRRAFTECRNRFYCPFLQNGKIYTCAVPPLVHYYNNFFKTEIIADHGIDIYQQGLRGGDILRFLNKPIQTCRWCTYDQFPFSWEMRQKLNSNLAEDWVALT